MQDGASCGAASVHALFLATGEDHTAATRFEGMAVCGKEDMHAKVGARPGERPAPLQRLGVARPCAESSPPANPISRLSP